MDADFSPTAAVNVNCISILQIWGNVEFVSVTGMSETVCG